MNKKMNYTIRDNTLDWGFRT